MHIVHILTLAAAAACLVLDSVSVLRDAPAEAYVDADWVPAAEAEDMDKNTKGPDHT